MINEPDNTLERQGGHSQKGKSGNPANNRTALTPSQERFCQEYVNNGCAKDAYLAAYNPKNMQDNSLYVEACRLKANPKISLRITEIRREHNIAYNIDRQFLTDNLLLVMDLAMMPDGLNLELIRKTTMDLAKLHGLIIDKIEDGRLNDSELLNRIKSAS